MLTPLHSNTDAHKDLMRARPAAIYQLECTLQELAILQAVKDNARLLAGSAHEGPDKMREGEDLPTYLMRNDYLTWAHIQFQSALEHVLRGEDPLHGPFAALVYLEGNHIPALRHVLHRIHANKCELLTKMAPEASPEALNSLIDKISPQ